MSAEQPVFAPGLKPTLEPVVSKLEKFIIYETTSFLYVVGCDKRQIEYRVLKLDRRAVQPSRLGDILLEDDCVYSREELKDMLEMIHEGNKAQGGLVRLQTGFGILGFVKFLDCYYLLLITQRRKVGSIGGTTIYGIKATEMVPIKPAKEASTQSWGKQMVGAVNRRLNPTQHEIAEQRYLGLFQFIDLTKDFYFSYTYDLTQPLQFNMAAATRRAFPPPPCKDMYAWNHYLTSEFESAVGSLNATHWCLPLVHGAFLQRKCTLFGRLVNLTLVARRSRHFAGTRYLKRGVSDLGKCANDVEMEQIVHEEGVGEGTFSSFLQVRGSIPTFWAQETSVTMPKPPIVLNRIDPTYAASQLHFVDLLERYSAPVLVLDLTKHAEKREREIIVSSEYKTAIECLNSSMTSEDSGGGIQYCALDFNHLSKQRHGPNVLSSLRQVACWSTAQTGLFVSAPRFQVDAATGKVLGPAPPSSGAVGNAATDAKKDAATAESDTATEATSGATGDEASSPPAPGASNSGSSSSSSSSKPTPQRTEKQSRGLPAATEQRGVLRTNCIDCLDRTNVAQFSVGAHALGLQLAAMGLVNDASLEGDSPAVLVLMDIYSTVGDQIALQYGGSEAHKKVAAGAGQVASAGSNGVGNALNLAGKASGSGGKHKELLTSIRRYYSNAFTDRLKQDAMNVFLGHYAVCEHEVALWDLDNDYYLHNFHVQKGVELTMSQFKEPWAEAEEEEKRLRKTQSGDHEAPGSPDSDLSSPDSAAAVAVAAELASKRALAQAAAADAAAGAAYYHEAAVAARSAARAAALEEHQAQVRAARQAQVSQVEQAEKFRSGYHNEGDGAFNDAQAHARAEEEKEKAALEAAATKAAQAAAEAEAAEARAALEAEKAAAARAAEAATMTEASQAEVPEKGVKKKKSFMKALSRPFGKKPKDKKKKMGTEGGEADDGSEGQQTSNSSTTTAAATSLVGSADSTSGLSLAATDIPELDEENNHEQDGNGSEGSGVDEARRSFDSDGSNFDENEPWSPSSSSSSSSYQMQDQPKARPRLSQEQAVRVRLRCHAQQRAIEHWWRDAQAKHDMNRLWMRLGPQQSSLNHSTDSAAAAGGANTTSVVAQPPPPQQQRFIGCSGRFDRVFRPDKLTQFDKLLSYDFNSPLPLHANQEVSHRSRGGFPGFPGGRRGGRRAGSGNNGPEGGDGTGGDGGLGGNDEGPVLSGDFSSGATAASGTSSSASHLPLEPRHASFRDAEVEDDEEGPDRAVALGKLVRDLFLLNRAQPRALGSQPAGSGDAPNGSSGNGSSSSRHKHGNAAGGRSILLSGQGSSGKDPTKSPSGSSLSGSTEEVSTSGSGLTEVQQQSRVEVSVSSSFVGTLGTQALGAAAQRESRRFAAISEFAQQPESYFGGTLHAEARGQFEVALWETSLPDDAVAGNRASSDLSHCARRLKHGPFKGCGRDTRATSVVLATEEPLAVLAHPWAKARGHLPNYDRPSSTGSTSSSYSSSSAKANTATATAATADENTGILTPSQEVVEDGTPESAAGRKSPDDMSSATTRSKTTDREQTTTPPLSSSLESTPLAGASATGGGAFPATEPLPVPSAGDSASSPPVAPHPSSAASSSPAGSHNQGGQRAATALAGLAAQGLNCEGVLGQIKHGLAGAQTADQVYEAALDSETQAAARTALTDASTFALYTSFFQDETLAADQSLDFMLRSPAPPKPQTHHPVLTSARKLVTSWPHDVNEQAGTTNAVATPEEAAAAAAAAAGAAAGAAAAAAVAAASNTSSGGANTGGAPGAWLGEVHLLPDLSTSLSEYGAYEAQIAAAEAAVAAAHATSSATARARAAADRDALEVNAEPSSPSFLGTYLPLNPPLPLPKHLQAAKDSAAAMRAAQRDRLVAAQLAQERKRLEARQWQPRHRSYSRSSPDPQEGQQHPAYYSTDGPDLPGLSNASPGHPTAAAIVADGVTAAGSSGGARRQPLTTNSATTTANSSSSERGFEPESPLGMPQDDLVFRKLGAHFADPSGIEASATSANASGSAKTTGGIDPVPEESVLDYDDDEDEEDFLGYFLPPPPPKPQGSQSSPSRGGGGGAGASINSSGESAPGVPPTRLYYGYERAGESSKDSMASSVASSSMSARGTGGSSTLGDGNGTQSISASVGRRTSLTFSPSSMPGRRRSSSNANSTVEMDQGGEAGAIVDENEDGFTRRGYMFAKADNPFVLFNAAGKQALAPK